MHVSEWDEIVAEVGAVLETGRGAASAAIHRALDIREHPRVFELFADGCIGLTHVRSVLRAGAAIMDAEIAAEFDERIAGWLAIAIADPASTVTAHAVSQAAARILLHLDRDAIPEKPSRESPARLHFHARSDGSVDLEAVLPRADAIRLSAAIEEVAATVCAGDARTGAERRVAALVALVSGYTGIGCLCGVESCGLREAQPRYESFAPDLKALAVIVLNESDVVGPETGSSTAESQGVDGESRSPSQHVGPGSGAREGDPAPKIDASGLRGGSIAAGGVSSGAMVLCADADIAGPVTADQARALIAACTTSVVTLGTRDRGTGEVYAYGGSGYRPTKYRRLAMQLIHPTCVFPGCTVPAPRCQADHVSEYDHADPLRGGATMVAGMTANGAWSPGNLVPLCAFHHRIKTETGWLSDICDDGSVEWRHPAGGTWRVAPGPASSVLPALARVRWRVRSTSPETGSREGAGPPGEPVAREQSEAAPNGARPRTSAQRRAERRRDLRAANRRNRSHRREGERGRSVPMSDDAWRRPGESAYSDSAGAEPSPF